MSENETTVEPLPVKDLDLFKETCEQMIQWVGTIEMPEERVGLREASGNFGGILVSLLMAQEASFYAEEATNVATLTDHLKSIETDANREAIIGAIYEGACKARDSGKDLNIRFE